VAAIVAVTLAGSPASAVADGDPASDVLAGQSLFLPQDAASSPRQDTQLGALLTTAHRDGYLVRVALIGSRSDLGSVTALWRQPQSYARFLGQELALVFRGTLLIVMPNGYGFVSSGGSATAPSSALSGVAPPGRELPTAAIAAVRRLAGADGHPLAMPHPTATAASPSGSASVLPWVVVAVGAALIGAAWMVSLRAQPHRVGRK
jgi:hypothetical protein